MAKEGPTHLAAEPQNEGRGPGAKSKDVAFYNPAMALNRDLSVLLVAAYAQRRGREIDVADVLAGTGARSVRIANEVDAPLHVYANDGDPKAIQAIQATAAANAVSDRISVSHGHAHGFLASRRFDVVDIDPYGAPTPFLDAAISATRHDGLVCITATDTGALSGTYPRVCKRRYGANHGLHNAPFRAEVGLRILAGTAIQAAGRFDRVATPLLSVCGGHWMRVVLRLTDGRRSADTAIKQLGHAHYEGGLGGFGEPGPGTAGPLWTGPLHDHSFVQDMLAASAERELAHADTLKVLQWVAEEANAPPFWVDLGELRALMDVDAPRRANFMRSLQQAGFAATRTHMDPQGVRTDADFDSLRNAWHEAQ